MSNSNRSYQDQKNCTKCLIDSATLYEFVEIARKDKLEDCSDWTLQSAVTATSALLYLDHVSIAPAPGRVDSASDIYQKITQQLIKAKRIKKGGSLAKEIIDDANTYLTNNKMFFRSALEEVRRDKSYEQWIQNGIDYSWKEHSKRLHGLYNKELIPQIAGVLDGISEADLYKEWDNSYDIDFLNKVSSGQIKGDQLSLLKNAYTVSALFRGYLHDLYAKKGKYQIIHHPFRKPALPLLDSQKRRFKESNVEKYLSIIVLAGAIAQKKEEERITTWLDNINLIHEGITNDKLIGSDSDEDAKDAAIKFAQDKGIRTSSKLIDNTINILLRFGIGCALNLLLQEFDSILPINPVPPLGMGEKINKAWSNRSCKLKKICERYAGRIEPEWTECRGKNNSKTES